VRKAGREECGNFREIVKRKRINMERESYREDQVL
jgi:hypothetical protein